MLALIMALLTATLVHAAPSGTFAAGEYEAAKAKAKEENKPIAIVTTNLKTTCPKCLAGTQAVFKAMKRDYIIVIEDDEDKGKIPQQVIQKTFEIYKTKGNMIPIVSVFSQKDESLLSGMCNTQIAADNRKAFNTLKEEVDAALAKQATVPPATEPTATENKPKPENDKPAATSSGLRDWVNAEGKTIKAEALSRTETTITFKLENGKVLEYPLDKLSEESRKYALDHLGEP
jgi:hypothetical protein